MSDNKKIHMLAGLPRSGSTLLANVLSQHPDVHVSGTSSLANLVDSVQTVLSNSPEIVSELGANPGMYDRYAASLYGLVHGFYEDIDSPIIIDKGRLWPALWTLIQSVFPESQILMTVRDPRDVIASIERRHRDTGLFASPVETTIYDAAEKLMVRNGMVGGPIRLAEDMLRRRAEGVTFVRFESFVVDPLSTIERIRKLLDLDPFDWDVENVVNRGGDSDFVWRGKFPHEGAGKIQPSPFSWSDIIDPELAAKIAGVYPLYMSTFSYGE